jgi:hypothetical protein
MKLNLILATVSFVIVFSFPNAANAQKVILVAGPVDSPANIKEKQILKPGKVVSVPEGSLVILEYRGPSDVSGYDCVHWDYVKGSDTATISATRPAGSCPIERNPTDCNAPGCMKSGQLYFYEEGKGDAPEILPEKVKASMKQRADFMRALGKMKAASTVGR